MTRPIAILLGIVLLGTAALGQTVPFAQPRPETTPNWSRLSLGNIMLLIQTRHIKLWYVGRAQDWSLVDFEVNHISDDLTAAAMLYTDIPVALVQNTEQVIARMKDAAKHKDVPRFQAAFSDLTASCNACHAAGGVGFIRIQTPINMPFTNQDIRSSNR
ncbi:hypothetical protein [Methylobacterium sp. NEAU K]|uniref:hypothetical protein n=1 Tax=Methylobacterium sp. NEAU K TaxID=3064946 RepID=UPI002736D667|nr:hypothetical protein [Methylobacterium sp. NEAU K]MDP4006797.1 hypothetical protein [Methylobacterium sp. NEAU K]